MAGKLSELNKPTNEEEGETLEQGKPTSKTQLRKLSTGVQVIDKKMSTLRGEKGAMIKAASADHNVDKQAFAESMKRYNMEPERRAEYQRNVLLYDNHMDIALQGDLLKDAPTKGAR